MIISMKLHSSKQDVDAVCERIRDFGYKIHAIEGEERVVIGVVGMGDVTACLESLEAMPQVEKAVRISAPYKFVSKEFKKQRTVITLRTKTGPIEIGGDEFVMMAGPCSVESEKQIMESAEAVLANGGKVLRGGAFKPRTSPYAFQGLGEEGLRILRRAADAHGLGVVSEVMDTQQVPLLARYADILQIGARNMQNYALLREVGQTHKPVMLKRGLSSTIEEWLLSAEHIMAQGNQQVMLCERGIRTFETYTRNTLDLNAVPVVKELSHLPIIVDPSHGVGIRDKIAPMARAGIAAGADGLIIEVHHDPDHALSDGPQSLYPSQFDELVAQIRTIAGVVGRRV